MNATVGPRGFCFEFQRRTRDGARRGRCEAAAQLVSHKRAVDDDVGFPSFPSRPRRPPQIPPQPSPSSFPRHGSGASVESPTTSLISMPFAARLRALGA